MPEPVPLTIDYVRGDTHGLDIPNHPEALRVAGVDFLTRAFRSFGALAPDNSITRITRLDPCLGGSTGKKLFLSVEYERPDPGLHTDLFVKFSRDFDDIVRDTRGKYELEGEVRAAAISRLEGFPINVPAAYFADYHQESFSGLVITQRIDFGIGQVEPHHLKCMDHEIENPIEHYRTIVRSLALIAAAHRSHSLDCDIDAIFPFDPAVAARDHRLRWDEPQLLAKIAGFAGFVERHPQLFPDSLVQSDLFDRMTREAGCYVRHEAEIRHFLQSDRDMIALCHWNGNIDNCWFWRDDAGTLHCGLMDWGHAGQQNLSFPLWGCLSGAPLDVWNDHFDELVDLYLDTLRAHGGPDIDKAKLLFHFSLHVIMMALTYFIESNERIEYRMPDVAQATDPFDIRFRTSETARNQLHISVNVLNLCRRFDVGATLDRFLALAADDDPARLAS